MRLIGRIRQITPDQLQALQDRPLLVRALISKKAELDTVKLLATSERTQEIALRAEGTASADDLAELEKARTQILREIQSAGINLPDEEPDEDGLSLEGYWHMLHRVITGHAGAGVPPLGDAILGGTPIGDDIGHGPARYLEPDQVRQVAEALSRFSSEELIYRFDPEAMAAERIYGAEQEDKSDFLEYYFSRLARYYADAAGRGNAMLLYVY